MLHIVQTIMIHGAPWYHPIHLGFAVSTHLIGRAFLIH